jgi:hypothetical protein
VVCDVTMTCVWMNREQREQCILALTSLVECADDDQALAAGCKAQGVDSHPIGDW